MLLLHLLGKQFQVKLKRLLTINSQSSSADPANTLSIHKLFVTIEDKEVPMEIDTGSSVTLLNSSGFFKMGNQIDTLKPPTVIRKAILGTLSIVLWKKR